MTTLSASSPKYGILGVRESNRGGGGAATSTPLAGRGGHLTQGLGVVGQGSQQLGLGNQTLNLYGQHAGGQPLYRSHVDAQGLGDLVGAAQLLQLVDKATVPIA